MSYPSEVDARLALHDAEHAQQRVIEQIGMPWWYWWGLAGCWIGLGVLSDLQPAWWVVVGATLVVGAGHSIVFQRLLAGRQPDRGSQGACRGRGEPRRARRDRLSDHAGCGDHRCRACALGRRGRASGDLGQPIRGRSAATRRPARDAVDPRLGDTPDSTVTNGARFDELIHPSTRLSVVALLCGRLGRLRVRPRPTRAFGLRLCRNSWQRSRRQATSRSGDRSATAAAESALP